MNSSANLLDQSQLDIEKIITEEIKKQAPDFFGKLGNSKVSILRNDFYQRILLNGQGSLTPFDTPSEGEKRFDSNVFYKQMPAEKIFIATGVQILTAQGSASTDDMTKLVFDVPTNAQVLNSVLSVDFGNRKVLDNARVQSLIDNGADDIPGYVRFPQLRAWLPNTEMVWLHRLPAGYVPASGKFDHVLYVLKGYLVQRSV